VLRWSDTTVTPFQAYTYEIRAYHAQQSSPAASVYAYSSPAPQPVESLSVGGVGLDFIDIAWIGADPNVTHYVVTRTPGAERRTCSSPPTTRAGSSLPPTTASK
jgi:hypothetical protein